MTAANGQQAANGRVSVSSVMGKSPQRQAGEAFLGFLRLAESQAAYARYGFVKAKGEKLKLKPIN